MRTCYFLGWNLSQIIRGSLFWKAATWWSFYLLFKVGDGQLQSLKREIYLITSLFQTFYSLILPLHLAEIIFSKKAGSALSQEFKTLRRAQAIDEGPPLRWAVYKGQMCVKEQDMRHRSSLLLGSSEVAVVFSHGSLWTGHLVEGLRLWTSILEPNARQGLFCYFSIASCTALCLSGFQLVSSEL